MGTQHSAVSVFAQQLPVLPEHPCSYLPGRIARSRGLWCERMDGGDYQAFMDAGFRRSGKFVYQPACRECQACVPIRVPVARFQPSKSQRRCVGKNQDVSVSAGEPCPSDEKFALYQRYISQWHEGPAASRLDFEQFLYDTPVDTVEFSYRLADGRLLAVGICDACAVSLSSVYFYFDPEQSQRSMGTFGAMYEIDFSRRAGIPYYYLGFWVNGCRSMAYKTMYRPFELLHPDGTWRSGGACTSRLTL